MPIFAIGDIQGCCDEFELLLERIQFDPGRDRLWLTGDLVNRGPRSLATLRLVKALGDAVITVLGNHDLHLLAIGVDPKAKRKASDTLDEILAAPDRDELLHWLRHRPMLHHDAVLKLTLLHAGLPPQWDLAQAVSCARELETALRDPTQYRELFTQMYGNDPDMWDEKLNGWERLRFITNCLTRLRVCSKQGRLKLKFKGDPQHLEADAVPWFRVPGRRTRSEQIICGHWSALGYYQGDNIRAIDTGCVWGGKLCAVRLDQPAPMICVDSLSGGLAVEE